MSPQFDDGETVTYNYIGDVVTEDLTGIGKIDIEIWGAGGASGENRDGEYAGDGGYVSTTRGVTDADSLEITVGQGGQVGEGGWGDDNGGDGGNSNRGAGGGGSSTVRADGDLLARGAAGGGGEGVYDWAGGYSLYSGGGGAPGGMGGTAEISGDDAEGSGNGGDGASYSDEPAEDGGGYAPGGTVEVGGGNSSSTSNESPGEDGEIQVTYYHDSLHEYTGNVQSVDVSELAEVSVELEGGSGQDGYDSDVQEGDIGGGGGYCTGTIDVSGIGTLDVYVGGGSGSTWGYANGGSGGGGSDSFGGSAGGGNGAGSSAIVHDGNLLLEAGGGGGGGGGGNDGVGGGGGGGGGSGGSGGSSRGSAAESGDSGSGSRDTGGDGGLGGDGTLGAVAGNPGSADVYSSRVSGFSSTTGGAAAANGSVLISPGQEDPPDFQVSITSTNSPVVEGETLDFTVDVSNGGGTGTQTIELSAAGSVQDSRELTVDALSSDQVTLSWDTTDSGEFEATVSSDDSSDSATVLIESDAPNGSVRVNGQPREIAGLGVRVNGELRDFDSMYVREDGSLREL